MILFPPARRLSASAQDSNLTSRTRAFANVCSNFHMHEIRIHIYIMFNKKKIKPPQLVIRSTICTIYINFCWLLVSQFIPLSPSVLCLGKKGVKLLQQQRGDLTSLSTKKSGKGWLGWAQPEIHRAPITWCRFPPSPLWKDCTRKLGFWFVFVVNPGHKDRE